MGLWGIVSEVSLFVKPMFNVQLEVQICDINQILPTTGDDFTHLLMMMNNNEFVDFVIPPLSNASGVRHAYMVSAARLDGPVSVQQSLELLPHKVDHIIGQCVSKLASSYLDMMQVKLADNPAAHQLFIKFLFQIINRPEKHDPVILPISLAQHWKINSSPIDFIWSEYAFPLNDGSKS